MRPVTLTATLVLAASFAVSFSAQEQPPAPAAPESAPPAAPPPASPPPDSPPPASRDEGAPEAAPGPGEDVEDVFIPTEELQPDAAVTFPVDI